MPSVCQTFQAIDVLALVTPSCESGATSPSSQITYKIKIQNGNGWKAQRWVVGAKDRQHLSLTDCNIFRGRGCHSLCHRISSRAAHGRLEAKALRVCLSAEARRLCGPCRPWRALQRSHRCALLTRPQQAQDTREDFRVKFRKRTWHTLPPQHHGPSIRNCCFRCSCAGDNSHWRGPVHRFEDGWRCDHQGHSPQHHDTS